MHHWRIQDSHKIKFFANISKHRLKSSKSGRGGGHVSGVPVSRPPPMTAYYVWNAIASNDKIEVVNPEW